jgi:hypothetical protein
MDLGNVHDVLQRLECHATEWSVRVFAFADLAFNGFGVNPPPSNKFVTVSRTKDAHKNAADIDLIWKCAELVLMNPDITFNFFIVTKDLQFQSLKAVLQKYPNVRAVEFFQSWEGLRPHVEPD